MIVQARAAVQLLAAGVAERLRRLAADLVDRLQAVGRESRRRHEDALTPASASRFSFSSVYGFSHSSRPKSD